MKPDYQTYLFENPVQWRAWLDAHHSDTDGVWLQYYKKDSGLTSIKYAEALDVALCYGWIDGQAKKGDELSYLQKFTPRRKRSIWSKRNIGHITRLTEAGLMTAAGQAEVDRAKVDGRWAAAYDAQRDMVVPDDFIAAIRQDKQASDYYDKLTKTDLFAIGFRLHTAKKAETRQRRFAVLFETIKNGQKLR